MFDDHRTEDFDSAAGLAFLPSDSGLEARTPLWLSNALQAVAPERGGPQGGYLAALAVRAAREALGAQAPLRTIAVQFLARPEFGPIRLDAARLRGGRSTLFAQVTASQEGDTRLTSLLTFGAEGRGPVWRSGAPEAVAPPEALERLELPQASLPHFTRLVDYRPAGAGRPFASGEEARIRLWMRLKDARALDEARLAFLFDGVFPAFFAVVAEAAPTATVDLRYDFAGEDLAAAAPDGWALFEFATRDLGQGWAVEDGTAWSREGRWLGTARQLRKVVAKTAPEAV